MAKCWMLRSHDESRIAALQSSAKVSPAVAQLLLCRGVADAATARLFLDAKLSTLREPDTLPGVSQAADLIHAAIAARRRIVIYGDYDADGMTATAILYRGLRLMGADVGYYVPNRLSDGYGLNGDALANLARQGASLVITVDCGVTSVAEAEAARRLGLELIITDHHQPGARLPDAAAIVHPALPGHAYPFGGLSGAAVAFKLAWALCQRASGAKRVSDAMRSYLLSALGLAAMGVVADVVPLLDENRIMVRHGLFSLKSQPMLGLQKLMRITQLDQKPTLTSEDVAFTLGPRLNAAGRLGQAGLGVELLVTESEERAEALAQYIHQLNEDRGSLERKVYRAANAQAKEHFDPERDPALVLAGRDWHPGIIGIVAGRLAENYHRPVVMLAMDSIGARPAVGSARTAGDLNLYAALADCRDYLATFGGHTAAAGLTIEEGRIDAFRAAFCEQVAARVSEADRTAQLHIDAEAPLSQLTFSTVKQIEQLAPFGEGNPRPLMCATGVQLREVPRRIGSGERHLSLKLIQHEVSMRGVGFGLGESAEELAKCQSIDLAYRPTINDFRGRQSVEVQVVDWRPANGDAPSQGPNLRADEVSP